MQTQQVNTIIDKVNWYFGVDIKNDKQYCVRELIKAKKVASVILRRKVNLKFHAMAYEFGCNGICLSKKSVSDSVDKAADLCTSIAEEYAQQNKWIDVNVELPYMGQLVIVYQDYGDNSSYSVIEWNKSEEKYYKLNNIKIWQPLPTPPQSQNK